MGKQEQRCLNAVKKHYADDGVFYPGITEHEKDQLIALIKTAKDTDGVTTSFPDFVGDNGWIEHFAVTSSQSTRKGYESKIQEAEMHRSIKEQVADSVGKGNFIQSFSASCMHENDSQDNYRESFKQCWEKHIESYNKKKNELSELQTKAFLVESDDGFLRVLNLSSMDDENAKSEERDLFFELIYDRELMDFMYQYKDMIDYVIFKGLHLTRILKVNSIPNIINATDYSNFFVHSIPGCFFSYGFHVGDDTRPPWE